jgi:hypothetical protein
LLLTWCVILMHQKEKVSTPKRDLQWFLNPVPSRTAKYVKTWQSVYILQDSYRALTILRCYIGSKRERTDEKNDWKEVGII